MTALPEGLYGDNMKAGKISEEQCRRCPYTGECKRDASCIVLSKREALSRIKNDMRKSKQYSDITCDMIIDSIKKGYGIMLHNKKENFIYVTHPDILNGKKTQMKLPDGVPELIKNEEDAMKTAVYAIIDHEIKKGEAIAG